MKKIYVLIGALLFNASLYATDYISLIDLSSYAQDFNTIGGEDVDPSTQEKTAYVRSTTLPDGWKVASTTTTRTNSTYTSATNSTTYIGGQSLANNAKNGLWNFGATGSTDRAVGGITTNADGGARTINVMARLHNDGGQAIKSLSLSYDIEKYRYGALAAGFTVQLYTSTDGSTWASAGGEFTTAYEKDANTEGAAVVPISTQNVSGSFNVTFPINGDLYLLWSISSTTGDDARDAQAFGIDNVSITPSTAHIAPTYAVIISDNGTIIENFDCLGGSDVTEAQIAAAADNKRSFERASTLPEGWMIERNTNGDNPREIGSFASASVTTMYIGGANLPSNAKNGTWNFGATESTDRALGGITTGVANETKGVTIMTHLYNATKADIESIELSYDIEQYRNCNNSAGFRVQIFTSKDGSTWTSAGASFCTTYSAAGNLNAIDPATSTTICNALEVDFPEESELYLAWNIAVSSGTTCNNAPALAIDNVSIRPAANAKTTGNGWASFSADKNLKAPEGVTVYKAEYQIVGNEETLELTEIANRVIPANTGVLMQGASNGLIKAFTDATNDEVAATDYTGNDLKASVEKTYLTDAKDYFCMRYFDEIGTVFQLYTGAYVPAGKAYLELNKQGGGPSSIMRRMSIVVNPKTPSEVAELTGDELHTIGAKKILKNGQMVILRGNEIYTLEGARVR